MKKAGFYFCLFVLGGLGYNGIEILWRGYSHWSMTLTGGVCVLALWFIQQQMEKRPLWLRGLVGSGFVTMVEFSVGCVVNLTFHWQVWDYSANAFNLLGQVCLPYSLLWWMLCMLVFWVLQGGWRGGLPVVTPMEMWYDKQE